MTIIDTALIQGAPATSNGRDLAAGGTFDVINPATGRVFAQAPAITPDQLDDVFAAAQSAYQDWKTDEGVRRETLRRAADAVEGAVGTLAPCLRRNRASRWPTPKARS